MLSPQILILGIGNTLLSDEGFGVHAVEYIRTNYKLPENVRLVDGATGGLLLMGDLLECDLAIILDIVRMSGEPGTFYLLEDVSATTGPGNSMHDTSLADILTSCELAGARPETEIYCMEPFDCQTVSASLTPQAAQKLPGFCEKIVEALKRRGIFLKNKGTAS